MLDKLVKRVTEAKNLKSDDKPFVKFLPQMNEGNYGLTNYFLQNFIYFIFNRFKNGGNFPFTTIFDPKRSNW